MNPKSKIRIYKSGLVEKNGDLYIDYRKENTAKRYNYKNAIGICCMPNCKFGYDLNVHHIIPLKKGGDDSFDNFIVLCGFCHRHNKLHTRWKSKRLELYVYKFCAEFDILGFDSEKLSDEEFNIELRKFLFNKQKEENEALAKDIKPQKALSELEIKGERH